MTVPEARKKKLSLISPPLSNVINALYTSLRIEYHKVSFSTPRDLDNPVSRPCKLGLVVDLQDLVMVCFACTSCLFAWFAIYWKISLHRQHILGHNGSLMPVIYEMILRTHIWRFWINLALKGSKSVPSAPHLTLTSLILWSNLSNSCWLLLIPLIDLKWEWIVSEQIFY